MRDRVFDRVLNIYNIKLLIGKDDDPQLQVLNPPLLT
jgi:hypothetical protein